MLSKAIFSRDRFGVKPLFYSSYQAIPLAFSSEMKELVPLLDKIAPSKHISSIFSAQFDYEFSSICAIDGITRLPPGSCAVYQNGHLSVSKWWNALDHLSICNDEYSQQVDSWRELFLDSVNLRMRSDVRIGTALSGGLDSSCVLAAMNFIANNSKNTFKGISNDWQHSVCCSYPGSDLDESRYAKQVQHLVAYL